MPLVLHVQASVTSFLFLVASMLLVMPLLLVTMPFATSSFLLHPTLAFRAPLTDSLVVRSTRRVSRTLHRHFRTGDLGARADPSGQKLLPYVVSSAILKSKPRGVSGVWSIRPL